ncbi:MAG: AraC family transcriptional regulator ligand-binding domain-containing protein [Trebonia sp.]
MSTQTSAASPPPLESVRMPRFQLAVVAAAGGDGARIAGEARVPGWALAADDAMISPHHALRLWELAEHALQLPDIALTAATRLRAGELDLYDYLFATAASLREGLAVSGRYLPLLTTNARLRVESESDSETTYSYAYIDAGGRGAELALQLSVAIFCTRARAGTTRQVEPLRVGFTQSAPRSHRHFTETLGTRQVDFDAPVTSFTFRTCDLDLPMRGANPGLARILRRYAASLPPSATVSWQEHFRQHLHAALDDGQVSLQAVAGRLCISPRTMQRRLAEAGTMWRTEVDAARQRSAELAGREGTVVTARLARQLGYADPRSLRHARRRWKERAPGEAT